LLLGGFAVWKLPREDEPQIIVPMIDVFVQMPGASAHEVEERVTKPMEKLLWEIPGVEYIYSTSSPGISLAIVRFCVGQDEEKSVVRLNQKLAANFDIIPPGATPPLVKPRSIDDVPILALHAFQQAIRGFRIAPDRGPGGRHRQAGAGCFRGHVDRWAAPGDPHRSE
jgi:multidrug efflux pump subunit AcrB